MNAFVSKHRILFFYIFAFVIAWSAWFGMSRVYQGGDPSPIVYVFSTLGGLGPLLSLFILEKLTRNEITVKQVLSQIRFRKASVGWFLLAIFTLPVLTLLGNVIAFWMGQDERLRIIRPGPDGLGLAVIPVMAIHFLASLLTSPLFEEPGWRGFALVGLQNKFGRTLGSLMVGVLWWAWHQPMNLTFGLQPSVYSAISMIALSFIIDSFFNLSGKNLLTAMLAHQSSGTVIAFIDQGEQNPVTLGLLLLVLVILRLREMGAGARHPLVREATP